MDHITDKGVNEDMRRMRHPDLTWPSPASADGGAAQALKPRLVFFQFRYEDDVAQFQLIHRDDHIRCLSIFFDVTVINNDADYQQVCDTYAPDLVLFETGVEIAKAHRLRIINTNYAPDIPKIAFMNADGCSEHRSAVLSDMEHWGIETCFVISVVAAEHLPEIAENIFVWPNFIDTGIFRDYGQEKVIPIMLTGSQSPRYPWRRTVYPKIIETFPSLVCPHAGYDARAASGRMLHGSEYARVLNASKLSPTCGSVVKDVVRKHFEIPGAKACLITERSSALELAGFADMETCVFADEFDVIDKIQYLFSNPDKLQAITEAGHALVLSRHTMRHRDQIYRWYLLNKGLAADERILQDGPFGPLYAVAATENRSHLMVRARGLHIQAFLDGEKHFQAGDYIAAERMYLTCLGYVSEFPEAKLKLSLCNLSSGKPKPALSWIIQPLRRVLSQYGADDPDPVEWACLVMCLLCLGRVREAERRLSQFPMLRHLELDRVRRVVAILSGRDPGAAEELPAPRGRPSIHALPVIPLDAWLRRLCDVLIRCGQADAARRIGSFCAKPAADQGPAANGRIAHRRLSALRRRMRLATGVLHGVDKILRPKPTLKGIDNPELIKRMKERGLEKVATAVLHLSENFSRIVPSFKKDRPEAKIWGLISKIASGNTIGSALLVGVPMDKSHLQTLRSDSNRSKDPAIVAVGGTGWQEVGEQTLDNCVTQINAKHVATRELARALYSDIDRYKRSAGLDAFDLVAVQATGTDSDPVPDAKQLRAELCAAKHVVLGGIDSPAGFYLYDALRNHPLYSAVSVNLDPPGSNAVFKRISAVRRGSENSALGPDGIEVPGIGRGQTHAVRSCS